MRFNSELEVLGASYVNMLIGLPNHRPNPVDFCPVYDSRQVSFATVVLLRADPVVALSVRSDMCHVNDKKT